MTTVSVVVPCYNYGRYLESCVGSVLAQPVVDVCVLIIDDASTDDSAEVADRLASRDSRIEVRRHHVNKGHIATYNEGLAWIDGDYAMLLSADDELTAGALARAARVMDRCPEVGMVYGRAVTFVDGQARRTASVSSDRYRVWSGADWLAKVCRIGRNFIFSPEVVVRASLQKRIGGYRSDLPHTADLEMWLRFAAHSDIGRICRSNQAYYRRHAASMSQQQFGSTIADLLGRKAAFDVLFRENKSVVENGRRLQETADRALAREALWQAARLREMGDRAGSDALVDFAVETCRQATSFRRYEFLQSGRAGPGSPRHLRLGGWSIRVKNRLLREYLGV